MRSHLCWILIILLVFGLVETSAAQDSSPEELRTRGRQAFEEGRYADAERELRRAIDGFGKVGNTFEIAATQENLSDILVVQERYPEAHQLLDASFEVISAGLTKYVREIASVLGHMSQLDEQTGTRRVSEAALSGSVRLREQLDPDSSELVILLSNLGRVYTDSENYKEAQNCLQRALVLGEKRGSGDPDLIPVLVNFAALYQRQKKWALAESYLLRANGIAEQSLRANHPNRTLILEHLGVVHFRQNKLDRAESEFRRALEIQRGEVGKESLRTVSLSLSLALVLTGTHQYEEARSLYAEALPAQERLHGSKAPEVATTLENFALLLQSMKNTESAAEMVARAKRIRAELSYTRSVKDLKQW